VLLAKASALSLNAGIGMFVDPDLHTSAETLVTSSSSDDSLPRVMISWHCRHKCTVHRGDSITVCSPSRISPRVPEAVCTGGVVGARGRAPGIAGGARHRRGRGSSRHRWRSEERHGRRRRHHTQRCAHPFHKRGEHGEQAHTTIDESTEIKIPPASA
jgi:hypothetical protein